MTAVCGLWRSAGASGRARDNRPVLGRQIQRALLAAADDCKGQRDSAGQTHQYWLLLIHGRFITHRPPVAQRQPSTNDPVDHPDTQQDEPRPQREKPDKNNINGSDSRR